MHAKTPAELRLHLANLSPKDAQFLRTFVVLLTDPKYKADADRVRAGHSCIAPNSKDGSCTGLELQGLATATEWDAVDRRVAVMAEVTRTRRPWARLHPPWVKWVNNGKAVEQKAAKVTENGLCLR